MSGRDEEVAGGDGVLAAGVGLRKVGAALREVVAAAEAVGEEAMAEAGMTGLSVAPDPGAAATGKGPGWVRIQEEGTVSLREVTTTGPKGLRLAAPARQEGGLVRKV